MLGLVRCVMPSHILGMTKPLETSPAGRAAAQKRKAADRARSYRARKKLACAPLAAAVDKAVSEAIAFHVRKHGVNIGMDVTKALKSARLMLERDGFSPAEAAKAVADRMVRPRDEHSWEGHFPTVVDVDVSSLRETSAGPWTTPVEVVLKHMSSI